MVNSNNTRRKSKQNVIVENVVIAIQSFQKATSVKRVLKHSTISAILTIVPTKHDRLVVKF